MTKKTLSRRNTLKLAVAGAAVSSTACSTINGTIKQNSTANQQITPSGQPFNDPWQQTHDRVWLGGQVWANPMEDWQVNSGGAECLYASGNRSIHALTHQLRHLTESFDITVIVQRLAAADNDGGASIRLGIKSELDDYRSHCFVQQGFDAGIIGQQIVLGNKREPLIQAVTTQPVRLRLVGTPQSGAVLLSLQVQALASGDVIGQLESLVSADELSGNVGIVSNFAIESLAHRDATAKDLGSRYRFSGWQMHGNAFAVNAEQVFGPVLWTMYSLSDSRSDEGFVMKLSAFTGPLGEKDNQNIELHIQRKGQWQPLDAQALHRDGWVATFRIPQWDASQDTPFRVVYREKHKDGKVTPDIYKGSIRANPTGRPLRMAGLTCQNDYGFPYAPVAENVVKLDPDLVFFSGDQLYETHGGFGIIREPAETAILNYLRKFYQFGWAFRDAMRNAPTICLPDDHDVLQGNLWGEGGTPMENIAKDPSASILGGYIEPIQMVNAVHRTSVGHHPDAFDPTPTDRGMSVYFGELVYGDVGFAILADRQWKSGPERVDVHVGHTGEDEDPLYINPDFNPDGLELLGQRQEVFLKQWSEDWRGHTLKAVLSQTVFAGIATHQPRPDRYLKYDFDGSGWPSKARNRAVELMRPAKALHICGDTHLGTLSQYGVDKQRDSNWAFCTPAIAAGWPRWWRPDAVGLPMANRPSHGLAQTGEYLDSFGNKIYVYAAGNPEVGKSNNRYVKAHEKGSGFGFITFDTQAKTYTLEAYRFLVDATDGNPANQFPGWPVTIHQDENEGNNRLS